MNTTKTLQDAGYNEYLDAQPKVTEAEVNDMASKDADARWAALTPKARKALAFVGGSNRNDILDWTAEDIENAILAYESADREVVESYTEYVMGYEMVVETFASGRVAARKVGRKQ